MEARLHEAPTHEEPAVVAAEATEESSNTVDPPSAAACAQRRGAGGADGVVGAAGAARSVRVQRLGAGTYVLRVLRLWLRQPAAAPARAAVVAAAALEHRVLSAAVASAWAPVVAWDVISAPAAVAGAAPALALSRR